MSPVERDLRDHLDDILDNARKLKSFVEGTATREIDVVIERLPSIITELDRGPHESNAVMISKGRANYFLAEALWSGCLKPSIETHVKARSRMVTFQLTSGNARLALKGEPGPPP